MDQPGLKNQTTVRSTLRWLGLALLVTGIVLVVLGFGSIIVQMAGGDPFAPDAHLGLKAAMFGGGGLLAVFGTALAGVGFQGAMARYSAGETMPVVKDSVAYLTDGEGLLGVGRTVDDAEASYCERCGGQLGAGARFCKGCGAAV